MSSIDLGSPAPDFTAPSTKGDFRLSDFRGKPVVLFFYPKDDTPGCTKEACSFRDAYDEFAEAGAEVVGISSDSLGAHERFAGKYGLQMRLVSDADGAVRTLYGITKTMWILPGRVTLVIDREGIVRHVFNSQLNPTRHTQEALGVVRSLVGGDGAAAPAAPAAAAAAAAPAPADSPAAAPAPADPPADPPAGAAAADAAAPAPADPPAPAAEPPAEDADAEVKN